MSVLIAILVFAAVIAGSIIKKGAEVALEKEYSTWAPAVARLLIKAACMVCSAYREDWLADLAYRQQVEHQSGLFIAASCLLSAPWVGRQTKKVSRRASPVSQIATRSTSAQPVATSAYRSANLCNIVTIKSNAFTGHDHLTAFDEASIKKSYMMVEVGTGRRYRHSDLTAAKPRGDVHFQWHGVQPYKGRHWAYSRENLDQMFAEGRIEFRQMGMPVLKRYIDEQSRCS